MILMKHTNYIFIALLLISTNLLGQHCVSGYVNVEHPEHWEQRVYLSQIDLKNNVTSHTATPIASTQLTKDGFFAFDKTLFTPKNHIYKLHLNPISAAKKKKLLNKIKNFKVFIVSKSDTVRFEKGETLFGNHNSTNKADREWHKLKAFESRYENLTSDFDTKQYLLETKGYVKDSLQILLVKLIGIKKLEDQNLLEKDIKANPTYYLDFLKELKSSEINPEFYLYLENKLTFVTKEITTQKYNLSLSINVIAFVIIIFLALFIITSHNKIKNNSIAPLSKQEKVIKELILSGKSNKEIANELFISLSTVKTHITSIYSKLNISNRQELLLKK